MLVVTAADEIAAVGDALAGVRASYEDTPLAVSVPMLDQLHHRLIGIGQRRINPGLRPALLRATSHVGSLRADALYNAGDVPMARRIAAHSVSVGRRSRDHAAYANASRVQSGIELGEVHPAYAVGYTSPVAELHTPAGIACVAARARGTALAGVGGDQVRRLADRALNAAYGLPASAHGVPGDEDPATCSPVEVAYHAAIAAATIGDLRAADAYAHACLGALPSGFQAVVHAYLGLAAARPDRAGLDIDRAIGEARQALAGSPTPFRALAVPLTSLARSLATRRDAGAADVVDAIGRWRDSARSA